MLPPSLWPPCFRPPTSPAWSNAVVSKLLSLPSCHPPEWHFLTEKITKSLMHWKLFQNRWFFSPVQLHLLSPSPQILVTWNDLLFLNRPSVSILQAFSHARNSQPHFHPCLENPSSSSHLRFRKYLSPPPTYSSSDPEAPCISFYHFALISLDCSCPSSVFSIRL